MVTGATPPVRVATLHRCGAENGSDKKTLQARVQREERKQLSQFSQPLRPSTQRRQVTVVICWPTFTGSTCVTGDFNADVCVVSCMQISWDSQNWRAPARLKS